MSRFSHILALSVGLMATPVVVAADAFEDAIVAQLNQQGFTDVNVSRTLLGRIRFIAIGAEFRREIVINPYTGEILRDYISALSDDGADSPSVPNLSAPSGSGTVSGGSSSGSGSSDDDDDEDDDEDDDKDDEDEKDHHNKEDTEDHH